MTLQNAMALIQKVVTAGGGLYLVFALVSFGQAIKEKNGSEIQSSLWNLLGGSVILAAGLAIGQIVLP